MKTAIILPSIDQVNVINFPWHCEDNGDLVVMEGLTHVPFSIARVFVVKAPADAIRGQHAHRACTQLLICTNAAVEVRYDDGTNQAFFVLDKPYMGLLIPPGIWAQQTFKGAGAVLTVLCDRPYEKDDYIHEYADFLLYRQALNATYQ